MLIVAGLTSGTFYPLTLTFALRNIPLRYLPLYDCSLRNFVDAAVNIALALRFGIEIICPCNGCSGGLRSDCTGDDGLHLLGIRRRRRAKKVVLRPSFAGFLLPERRTGSDFCRPSSRSALDWWRSGVFNACLPSRAFLLVCALVRRLRGPNPLVALPYL